MCIVLHRTPASRLSRDNDLGHPSTIALLHLPRRPPLHSLDGLNFPQGRLTLGSSRDIMLRQVERRRAGTLAARGGGTTMALETIIVWLIVGAIAGWLAGQVVRGGGFGLVGDIVVGIVGAVIAGWLLPRLGIVIGSGIIAAIIDAFIGAVILLLILRLVKRA